MNFFFVWNFCTHAWIPHHCWCCSAVCPSVRLSGLLSRVCVCVYVYGSKDFSFFSIQFPKKFLFNKFQFIFSIATLFFTGILVWFNHHFLFYIGSFTGPSKLTWRLCARLLLSINFHPHWTLISFLFGNEILPLIFICKFYEKKKKK